MTEVNSDFSIPVFLETNAQGTTVLESVQRPARQTLLHRLDAGVSLQTSAAGSELYVISGKCHNDQQYFAAGHYLRFSESNALYADEDCIVFEKSSQYKDGDTGNRVIDTNAGHLWLPGPVDGISICPLHGFETESIMLLKWLEPCEFKPGLDPQGEELLVIEGRLQNRSNTYHPFAWLRNPVEDWRHWRGNTGTLVYYKSGHFPATSM